MCSKFIKKILPLLKEFYLVEADCTEEELLTTLYGKSEERLNILQWLLSQISEDNKLFLLSAECIENEVAHQLHELEFINISKNLLFVKGECSVKEQKSIYFKMFRALNFVIFLGAKPPDQEYMNVDLHLQNKFTIQKENKLKKPTQAFDVNKAWATFEEAKKLLAESEEGCVKPYEVPELKFNQDSGSSVTKADLDKLRCFSTSLSNSLSTSVQCTRSSVSSDSPVEELSSAVTDFHKTLQSIKATKEKGETETTKIDMTRVMEDINEFKKNSKILNFTFPQKHYICNA